MFFKPFLASSLLLAYLLGINLASVANPRFQRFFYKPRTGMGIPQNSLGGTTRSAECKVNCVKVLVPTETIPLTTAERPSFFLFVPTMTEGKARFQLFDQQSEKIYQTNFNLTATGGIIQFNLPAEAPALEVDKTYQWRMVITDGGKRNEVIGFVRRVSLTEKPPSEPIKAAETYAQSGIWLDMFRSLADAKTPEAKSQIQELLKSIKFDAIATQPLLECCKP